MYKCDLHMHTNFCDGADTARAMVCSAIDKGCETMGFSGHAYAVLPSAQSWCMRPETQLEYAAEVNALRAEFDGKIKILLGAELDYYSPPLNFKADYTIGSVHALKVGDEYFDLDNKPEILLDAIKRHYGGEPTELAKHYYSLVAQIVDKTDCDIIGHFDLITKFNEKVPIFDTQSDRYRTYALEVLDALIEKDRVFEINTGAISRCWRTEPYPENFILRRLAERGARVMINSDAHSAEAVMYCFEAAEKYARSCGIKELVRF